MRDERGEDRTPNCKTDKNRLDHLGAWNWQAPLHARMQVLMILQKKVQVQQPSARNPFVKVLAGPAPSQSIPNQVRMRVSGEQGKPRRESCVYHNACDGPNWLLGLCIIRSNDGPFLLKDKELNESMDTNYKTHLLLTQEPFCELQMSYVVLVVSHHIR